MSPSRTPTWGAAPARRAWVGEIELLVLSDGLLRSPAKRMTGAVPAEIAARHLTPDPHGDLWLGLNCVLVRTPDCLALVDTGFGDGPLADDPDLVRDGAGLTAMLRAHGIDPGSLDLVINTHLHTDHIGGNLAWEGDRPRPAFPNAEYLVQRDELDWALAPDVASAPIYEPEQTRILVATGRVRALNGDVPVAPGIRVVRAPGHSVGHQVVVVESAGEGVAITGDLAPLLMHVRHPMHELPGDQDPAAGAASRQHVVRWAAAEGVSLASYHEPGGALIEMGDRS
jgi:glyoxylase-like metal-dependent hydrolase (beta-lactamase superfamily II)